MMHIGMGLVCGSKIKDLIKAGFEFIIFLADWHSWINNKFGGDIEKIRICGDYFKHCFTAIGIPRDKVRYLWASDLAGDSSYWEKVIRVAKSSSMSRLLRALPIMGRDMAATNLEAAAMLYPCMQVADIFHMDLDVACAGMDQRKAHMLARDSAPRLGFKRPICVHTPLLMGLSGPEKKMEGKFDEDPSIDLRIGSKMSKSIPQSSIFVHDDPATISSKIRGAYCPPKAPEDNPVMEIVRLIIMPELGRLDLERPGKYGGPVSFFEYSDLRKAYSAGDIHPLDLKNSVSAALSEILEPVRSYFESNPGPLKRMMDIEVEITR
jgi:tyrosyl-tRNA synthetase